MPGRRSISITALVVKKAGFFNRRNSAEGSLNFDFSMALEILIDASRYVVEIARMFRVNTMTFQLNRTFGSVELNVIEAVLRDWCVKHNVEPSSADGVLAGAVLVSLFQAGNVTIPALEKAAAKHKWLSEFNG